jgi:hypothetical protein
MINSAKPIATRAVLMGFATLNPSYKAGKS